MLNLRLYQLWPSVVRKCVVISSLASVNNKAIELQQKRSYVVLKLVRPPPRVPLGRSANLPPNLLDVKDIKYETYEVVENVELDKQPPIQVLLTRAVAGLGNAGDLVFVDQALAYYELLVPGLAVYPTSKNREKYREQIANQKIYSSKTALTVIECLERMVLSAVMNKETPWKLEPWHIKASFRKAHVMVPLEAIELPKREITGPNLDLENKEFYVTVTINKKDKARVRCRIHHWSTEVEDRLPYNENFFMRPAEPIFPEDAEILQNMAKKWDILST